MSLTNVLQRHKFLKKMFYKPLLGICIMVMLQACGENPETRAKYQSEIEVVCSAFDPEFWSEASKNLEPAEIQQLLTDRLSAATQSQEIKLIINQLNDKPINERYNFYIFAVGQLTNEPHECLALRDYFSF